MNLARCPTGLMSTTSPVFLRNLVNGRMSRSAAPQISATGIPAPARRRDPGDFPKFHSIKVGCMEPVGILNGCKKNVRIAMATASATSRTPPRFRASRHWDTASAICSRSFPVGRSAFSTPLHLRVRPRPCWCHGARFPRRRPPRLKWSDGTMRPGSLRTCWDIAHAPPVTPGRS